MENENLEQIGEQVDRIENLIGALNIPMPAEFHIQQIKEILPEVVDNIKKAIISESGENPWE